MQRDGQISQCMAAFHCPGMCQSNHYAPSYGAAKCTECIGSLFIFSVNKDRRGDMEGHNPFELFGMAILPLRSEHFDAAD